MPSFLHEAGAAQAVLALLSIVVSAIVAAAVGDRERRRFVLLRFVFAAHVACIVAATMLRSVAAHTTAQFIARLLATWLVVGALDGLLFGVVLPRTKARVPGILRDLCVMLAVAAVSVFVARRAGYDVSGLLTTSALLTAVIGFALQDTLGNLVSGLALQVDSSIRVGDWLQVGERQGWVTEISWRYTAIQTRDWDTILIPNSQITKSNVHVLGRRDGQPQQQRRFITFDVDQRQSPGHVIEVVQDALRATPMRLVAETPPPFVECLELREGMARYGAFYWLTDLKDVVDSDVRERVWTALQRAGIALSIPARAVSAVIEDEAQRRRKHDDETRARLVALEHVGIFSALAEEDRLWLAKRLDPVRFARGEVLTKQHDTTASLFIVEEGEVSVRVAAEGLEKEVARLGPGSFFGEMSLLTGEPRSATVVASVDALCYRLERGPAEELLQRRPDLAESMADVLAKRKVELAAVREGLDHEAHERVLTKTRGDLVGRIRHAFRLEHRRAG